MPVAGSSSSPALEASSVVGSATDGDASSPPLAPPVASAAVDPFSSLLLASPVVCAVEALIVDPSSSLPLASPVASAVASAVASTAGAFGASSPPPTIERAQLTSSKLVQPTP